MEKIAICAIFKDEAHFILEWIAYHVAIGVDLFLLYDNGSTDGGADLIRRSKLARNVTIIDWPGPAAQMPAYQDFCARHAARFDWVAIIDVDEFIVPATGNSIRGILIQRAYADYSAILMQWLVFGPSGHEERPDGLVIENYTRRMREDFPVCHQVKSLARGKAVTSVSLTPHIINVSGPTCNTRGQTVYSHAEQRDECHEMLAINHYFTKSREDWQHKLRRGKADMTGPTDHPYPDHMYFAVERDAVIVDTSITRFAPRVRELLRG